MEFAIDNWYLEGFARTIGFWKNCPVSDRKGNQSPVLEETLGIVDAANSSIEIGTLVLTVEDCQKAVSILDKRDGKKMDSDPPYDLAVQLLAARLNFAAQAGACFEAVSAADEAQVLLLNVGFNGTGKYKNQLSRALACEMLEKSSILDWYNNDNGAFCSP